MAVMERLDILRTLDKRDRLGDAGVFDLLTEGRRDASGAFTPGCGLSSAQAVTLLAQLYDIDAQFNPGNQHAVTIARRFRLIELLEATAAPDGTARTAWDMVLDAKPANVAAALDDLWSRFAAMGLVL